MNKRNLDRIKNLDDLREDEENIIFVKLLITDNIANKILANSASILKKVKQVNHVLILVSGVDRYFPGTNYRVATMEGNEKNVNETMEVLDFILKTSSDDESPRNHEYSLRLAVPRSVIGSIIGIKGEFIRHVRNTTNAHINISPIFVTSDKACNERIITISGNDMNQVIHAFIILTKKVNSSPEGRSCKGIIYRRNDIFRKKNKKNDENRIDFLLNSQLEEMSNVLNNKSVCLINKVSVNKENLDKPKFNYRISSSNRWSENVDFFSQDDDINIDSIKKCENNDNSNLDNKKNKKTSYINFQRISTNIFIISLLALIAGTLFLQYISKEIIYE